ncbi:MAG: BREX system P-loop protein BrxC [Faecalicoccus sp.]|nr:BREX system P-loop protein BrxC [Faecalicoccus sp.]
MKIRDMFKDDINRSINGVIQVEQEQDSVVEQEIKEYVVTTELKKHFNKFFESYADSFDNPTDNIGVWITGFFGSGKSHFLKMLSYLLENKEIGGRKTVDYFREKYDDELSFLPIQKATSVPTETILFNIDVEGPMQKDATAVLKVFAKVFYNHLGFYGNDLKLAKLEQFITKKGKMDEFKEAFEEINGDTWLNSRAEYEFFEDDIIECLVDVVGLSRDNAQHWFDGTESVDMSIAQLVDEIKAYVQSKPKDFRLLFMIDEAGQYIGTETSLLLNLQSLIEKLGSECRGQVWVVATGQEALDEMIKVRTDEFSRIMARFKVRLSLTSSSVGEVIEKRLLSKKDDAQNNLEMVYDNNDAVLRNLYSFKSNIKDIRGYKSGDEFVRQFPFVPYQFIVMQKIYNEIRKHGHTGKHQSQGERSMLNGFQESAQSIEDKNEFSIVPLYAFYDTLHSSLDTAVRGVIERAERAAQDGLGLEKNDVNLLKLLYLIRYIDDIPSNIDNLIILMADDIRVDKLDLRKEIQESLDRLYNQNYITRTSDLYLFLTDEEQDIARDIRNTDIDSSAVVSQIGSLIFDDIYSNKRYRYKNKYDFEFNSRIDGQNVGQTRGEITLKFYTDAADPYDKDPYRVKMDSMQNMAICILSSDSNYYEKLETVAKIRKYAKQKNINQLSPSVQRIVQDRQNEANRLEKEAKDDIAKAIVDGSFYICGEYVPISGTSATNKVNDALQILVENTYTKLGYIDDDFDSDMDIVTVLKGQKSFVEGFEPNKLACDDILDYLDTRFMQHIKTTMYDIQERYKNIPYGWRELDIAGVVALLIYYQKVIIKVNGQVIPATDAKMINYLRKKSDIGSTQISKRESINPVKLKNARDFLREYFDVMDVPSDEDGLFAWIEKHFKEKREEEFNKYKRLNDQRHYPGYDKVLEGTRLVDEVLKCTNDGTALIDKINSLSDDLLDNKDDMDDVKTFFNTQKTIFDNATQFNNTMKNSIDYFTDYPDVKASLMKIKEIVTYTDNYNYSKIKDLNGLISTVNTAQLQLVSEKRKTVLNIIDQCMDAVNTSAKRDMNKLSGLLNQARIQFDRRKEEILKVNDLSLLDAKIAQITNEKDNYIRLMDNALKPVKQPQPTPKAPVQRRVTKTYYRNVIIPQVTLRSNEDIDRYLASLKDTLESYLNNCDELEIK